MDLKKSSINNCKVLNLNNSCSSDYVDIENLIDIPFKVKRVYYLYDIVNNLVRGEHAHRELYQLIIGLNKGFKITIDDGNEKRTVTLDKPDLGLLIVPGIWRTLSDFSSDSICLVLASDFYKESDYIRNYSKFLKYKNDSH